MNKGPQLNDLQLTTSRNLGIQIILLKYFRSSMKRVSGKRISNLVFLVKICESIHTAINSAFCGGVFTAKLFLENIFLGTLCTSNLSIIIDQL